MNKIKIIKATKKDSFAIANIHKQVLKKGFLSTLPIKYLEKIYSYIIANEIVFIARDNNNIIGYIALSLNTKKMFKIFIKKNIIFFLPYLIKKIFSTIFFKKIFETISSPNKINNIENKQIIIPELLSIAINSKIQNKGVGKKLLLELELYLQKNNIIKYKVIAGEKLISANKFYKKNDFKLFDTIIIHNNEKSNIYLKNIKGSK